VQRVTAVPAQVLLLRSRLDEQVKPGHADDGAERVHSRTAVRADGGQEGQADAELVDLLAARARQEGLVLAAALPPDEHGWRVLTLSFEHERAAAHRLAGFGDQVEILAPPSVRAGLVATARQILRRYDAADDG
jgi:predicted DNA-binding transcriptional regulator YafY